MNRFAIASAACFAGILAACSKATEPHLYPVDAAPVAAPAASSSRTKTPNGISFEAPPAWNVQVAPRPMRDAQMRIPRAEGDAKDGELVVYYFGPGQGGSVESNVERWYTQFEQPDGSPSKEKAKIETRQVGGLRATVVELSGRYVAAITPGAPEKYDEPGWKLFAAIVETAKGPFFFKGVGPERTIAAARPALDALLASVRLEG